MKRRDWSAARDKVEAEGRCRVCKSASHGLDSAHVIPRSLAPAESNMSADSIVPLCRICHTAFDAHEFSLLEHLTLDEQLAAVRAAGSLDRARRIITGERL